MKKKKQKVKPLNLPQGINLYDEMLEMVEKNPDIAVLVDCIHETLRHFHVPEKNWRTVGDVIERFSMMMSLQDEPLSITGDDPALHAIADMYEYFNRLAEKKEGKHDAFPSWPRRFK